MNKATKWILFGAAAGATAAGVYYVLKNKEKFCVEETNPDGTTKRSYVPLDMGAAKAKVTDAYNKTVEKAQEVWQKVEEKFDNKDEEDVVANEAEATDDVAADIADAPEADTVSEDISDFSNEEEV